MQTAEYWIEKLQLERHPEGGFYSETYRSAESTSGACLPKRFGGDRPFSTAIYFLLRSEDISAFHRIKSDEIWFFHVGSSVEIYLIGKNGVSSQLLGGNFEAGERFQVVVPANTWFGAKLHQPNSYALVSCTVSPGFHFQDFELAKRDVLLAEFPENRALIEKFTGA